MVTILMILSGFSFLPYVISAIVGLIIRSRQQFRAYVEINSNTAYILLCGVVDYEILHHFLSELYTGKPNNPDFAELFVVILSPHPASRRVKSLMNSLKFRDKILFLQGSAKNSADLRRICVESFTAVYITRDFVTPSLRIEEDSIFLSAISVSKYLKSVLGNLGQVSCAPGVSTLSNSRQVVATRPLVLVKMTHTGRGQSALISGNIDVVISMQEFKCCLIGMGAVIPGFIAVFANLCRATNYLRESSKFELEMLHDYFEGTEFSLREVPVEVDKWSCEVLLMTFVEATRNAYLVSGGRVILVAALREKRRNEDRTREKMHLSGSLLFLVNPKEETIMKGYYSIFAISKSFEEAQSVFLTSPYEQSSPVRAGTHMQMENIASLEITEFRQISSNDSASASSSFVGRDRSNHRDKEPEDGTEPNQYLTEDTGIDQKCLDDSDSIKFNFQKDGSTHTVFGTDNYSDNPAIKNGHSSFLSGLCSFGCSNFDAKSDIFDLNFRNHIVIVMESPKSRDLNSIMLHIIYCLRSIRKCYTGAILVLSERALELSELASDIQGINKEVLSKVFFYLGHPRNPNHLKKCYVYHALSVILLGSEDQEQIPSVEDEGDESMHNMVQIDRHKTVTCLNLHSIYNDWSQHSKRPCKTFTVVELAHEINIKFLSQAPEWPLIISGSVFCHSVIDALMVSAIFNPNIVLFWNIILNVEGIESMENKFRSSEAFYRPLESAPVGLKLNK